MFKLTFIEHDLQEYSDFYHCGIYCLIYLENLLQNFNLKNIVYNADDLMHKRIQIVEKFETLSSINFYSKLFYK